MKEIPYLELEKDSKYFLLITNAFLPPTEVIVKFESYELYDEIKSKVNFRVFNGKQRFPVSTLELDNFKFGTARIYSVTEDEIKVLQIK